MSFDGTAPCCVRCLLPIHWADTFTPFCDFVCMEAAATEAGERAWNEELAGRNLDAAEMACWGIDK